MSRPDADTLLRRALERSADLAGVALTIVRSDQTRWASATFAGARHEFVLELMPSDRADAWLGRLPDADLPLRDHLVADLKVIAVTRTATAIVATIEALTVAER